MSLKELAENSPYNSREFPELHRFRAIREILGTYLYMHKNNVGVTRILDIGCGDFKVLSLAKEVIPEHLINYVGLDLNMKAIHKAPERATIYEWNIENTPYNMIDDNSIDIVVCTEVLEHLVHPERIYQEAARVLQDDGIFILSTPNADWMAHQLKLENDFLYDLNKPWTKEHIRWFNAKTHEKFLKDNNFIIQKTIGTGMEFCPIMSTLADRLALELALKPREVNKVYDVMGGAFPKYHHSVIIVAYPKGISY